eukprot:Sdes_comp20985_c0_seq1m19499
MKLKFHVFLRLQELMAVPYVSGVMYADIKVKNGSPSSFTTPPEKIINNSVCWNYSINSSISVGKSINGTLDSSLCVVTVNMENRGGIGSDKLGFVEIDLASFAGGVESEGRILLRGYDSQKRRLNNSILRFSVLVKQTSGDPLFKTPKMMASVTENQANPTHNTMENTVPELQVQDVDSTSKTESVSKSTQEMDLLGKTIAQMKHSRQRRHFSADHLYAQSLHQHQGWKTEMYSEFSAFGDFEDIQEESTQNSSEENSKTVSSASQLTIHSLDGAASTSNEQIPPQVATKSTTKLQHSTKWLKNIFLHQNILSNHHFSHSHHQANTAALSHPSVSKDLETLQNLPSQKGASHPKVPESTSEYVYRCQPVQRHHGAYNNILSLTRPNPALVAKQVFHEVDMQTIFLPGQIADDSLKLFVTADGSAFVQ